MPALMDATKTQVDELTETTMSAVTGDLPTTIVEEMRTAYPNIMSAATLQLMMGLIVRMGQKPDVSTLEAKRIAADRALLPIALALKLMQDANDLSIPQG